MGKSGYLVFGSSVRKEVKNENPDMKMCDIQKEIANRWKQLTEEEKQKFNEQAAAENEANKELNANKPKKAKAEAAHAFPLARVKQAMKENPELGKISKAAVICTTEATKLFLEMLAKDSHEITASFKRKTIKPNDVALAISRNRQLYEFLDEDIEIDESAGQIHVPSGTKASKKRTKSTASSKTKESPTKKKKKQKSISSFFK
eukprot:TRINITY_DN43191_c0_g1_i1.p1 TRINITY_DN43191_c0_g1~~TRINITY_DN43191_c0_g1_i1.p1  ORF type:complete len:204 (-),score=62.32 TRINITY_DN43191_c0_g1_i1:36-647(-)